MKSKLVTFVFLGITLMITGCSSNSEFLTFEEVKAVAGELPCDTSVEFINETIPQCMEHPFEGQSWFLSWKENDETWVERRLCGGGRDTAYYLVGPNWFVTSPGQYYLIDAVRLDKMRSLLGGEILAYSEICAKS